MFTDISPMQWGGYNLNVAAGIQEILIKTMKPEWNRAEVSKKLTNTHGEYEDLEIHLQRLVSLQLNTFTLSFKITLGNTYYKSPQGFMNPGVNCDQFFADHEAHATLHFGT